MLTKLDNPMSIKRSGRRTRSICVSSSLSKIPYVGFSPIRLQTGIQPQPSPKALGLSTRPAFLQILLTYMRLKSVPLARVAQWAIRNRIILIQAAPSPSCQNYPVQRPLAPPRVMLSRWINAYYGLIRVSRSLPSIYALVRWVFALRPCMGWGREIPQFTLRDCSRVPPSVPRWTERLQSVVASPFVLAFTQSVEARHPLSHVRRFCRGSCNEAAKFALCCGPTGLLALHRQGRLLSSFHLPGRPKKMSNITTRANNQFPRPDLHRQVTQPYGLQTD